VTRGIRLELLMHYKQGPAVVVRSSNTAPRGEPPVPAAAANRSSAPSDSDRERGDERSDAGVATGARGAARTGYVASRRARVRLATSRAAFRRTHDVARAVVRTVGRAATAGADALDVARAVAAHRGVRAVLREAATPRAAAGDVAGGGRPAIDASAARVGAAAGDVAGAGAAVHLELAALFAAAVDRARCCGATVDACLARLEADAFDDARHSRWTHDRAVRSRDVAGASSAAEVAAGWARQGSVVGSVGGGVGAGAVGGTAIAAIGASVVDHGATVARASIVERGVAPATACDESAGRQ